MRKFADLKGREWNLLVTVQSLIDVRAVTRVDLGKIFEAQLQGLGELVDDPARLVDVLWTLCQLQAADLQVTPEDFGRSLAGDVLQGAIDALVHATIDFFPNAQRRELLRQLVGKSWAALDLLDQRGLAEVSKLDAATLCDFVSNLPGLPASTPGRSA